MADESSTVRVVSRYDDFFNAYRYYVEELTPRRFLWWRWSDWVVVVGPRFSRTEAIEVFRNKRAPAREPEYLT